MNRKSVRCAESARVQDYLEELLPRADAEAFRAHLSDCRECAAELIAWRRVLFAMSRAPLEDPGPKFTERVLSIVIPARARRRWIKTVGWAYAASLTASAAGVAAVLAMPQTRPWLDAVGATISRHLVQAVVVGFNLLEFAAVGVTHGVGAFASLGERIVPLYRAFSTLLTHPPIELAFVAAASACAGVLIWLHGRERTGPRGIDPLGLLGM